MNNLKDRSDRRLQRLSWISIILSIATIVVTGIVLKIGNDQRELIEKQHQTILLYRQAKKADMKEIEELKEIKELQIINSLFTK